MTELNFDSLIEGKPLAVDVNGTVGMSRVWGGIHWMQSNYAGLQLGEWVGLKMCEMIDFSSLGLNFPLS
jgi:hypothetical protein